MGARCGQDSRRRRRLGGGAGGGGRLHLGDQPRHDVAQGLVELRVGLGKPEVGLRQGQLGLHDAGADEAFDEDGSLSDPEQTERLRELIAELTAAAAVQTVAA